MNKQLVFLSCILPSMISISPVLSKNNYEILQEIKDIYELAKDAPYLGEPVSQLNHALQCAYFALTDGADEKVIVAALLHDIGHLCAKTDAKQMGGFGVFEHELIGAEFLKERGFPDKIVELVKSHIQAKRYLTYKYPEYYQKLSEGSKQTFLYQGGPMSKEEALIFENDPLFAEKVNIRLYEEKAKQPNLEVYPFEFYEEMILRQLS